MQLEQAYFEHGLGDCIADFEKLLALSGGDSAKHRKKLKEKADKKAKARDLQSPRKQVPRSPVAVCTHRAFAPLLPRGMRRECRSLERCPPVRRRVRLRRLRRLLLRWLLLRLRLLRRIRLQYPRLCLRPNVYECRLSLSGVANLAAAGPGQDRLSRAGGTQGASAPTSFGLALGHPDRRQRCRGGTHLL